MGNVFSEIEREAFATLDMLKKIDIKKASEDELKMTIALAKARNDTLVVVLGSAKLRLEVIEAKDNFLNADTKMPEALGG